MEINYYRRLLIDARQSEETRVITTTNDIIDDFEYEVHSRRQLKGNIYPTRVTELNTIFKQPLLNTRVTDKVFWLLVRFTLIITEYL